MTALISFDPVGKKVKHVKAGDRVAMEPGATCRVCEDCKRGRYEVRKSTLLLTGCILIHQIQLCPDIVFAATPPYDGTLARYYRLPGDLTYKLPDNLTLEDGAMMEPLSVGIHSVANIGQFRANQSIVVFGAGPVGLLCMAVAKALGASRVIAVDIVPSRLEFAKAYAATETYLPVKLIEGETKMRYSERNAQAMKEQLGIEERGKTAIDLVVDASGAEVSVQTGIIIARQGGSFVQVRLLVKASLAYSANSLVGWNGSTRDCRPHHNTADQGGHLQGLIPLRSTFYLPSSSSLLLIPRNSPAIMSSASRLPPRARSTSSP